MVSSPWHWNLVDGKGPREVEVESCIVCMWCCERSPEMGEMRRVVLSRYSVGGRSYNFDAFLPA